MTSHHLSPGKISDRFTLLKPLQLEVEDDGEDCIVGEERLLVYGEGKTLDTAVADYLSTLTEFYEILKASADANQASLRAFEELQSFVIETP